MQLFEAARMLLNGKAKTAFTGDFRGGGDIALDSLQDTKHCTRPECLVCGGKLIDGCILLSDMGSVLLKLGDEV